MDLIYQDVAQRNQAQIASSTAPGIFVPRRAVLLLKSRSVDTRASPRAVLQLELKKLIGLELMGINDLSPIT